jgi:hypothetical protein
VDTLRVLRLGEFPDAKLGRFRWCVLYRESHNGNNPPSLRALIEWVQVTCAAELDRAEQDRLRTS